MLDFPRWKVWLISLTMVFGLIMAIPSLLPETVTSKWPSWVPAPKINLGLDLSGGSHILLEGNISGVAKARLEVMEETVKSEMRNTTNGPRIDIGDVSISGGEVSFMVRDSTQVDAAVDRMRNQTRGSGMSGQRDWDVRVVDSTRIVITPTEAGLNAAVDSAMQVATEVVRSRIDQLGTREPTIIRQGTNRIVVQVPGLQNPEALKSLLGKTAKLEFKMVDLTADPAMVAQGRAPVGSQVLPMVSGGAIAVKRSVVISGDQLVDATQAFGQNNEAVVTIRFDGQGGRKFARVTQENTGKPFAIILDGKVLSAPNINEPILGGTAQISGSFTVESANELAISLRSGKLPVELKVVEERTVGPDLGADSIKAGAIASVIATLVVIVFMLVTYGRFGIYASVGLMFNIFLILAVMAMFNATLTLPGIAGFVLTIGATVDANVLVNERIREELRRGRNVVAAIETGYKEASRTIFDANFTNLIAAVIMIAFGSGPVKGFAVVLTIGIATSVFTAVTFTRMIVALWLRRARPSELVI